MECTTSQNPLSTLNDMMAKVAEKPKLSLISHKTIGGISAFMMQVTCPISTGGPPLSAKGCYGRSLKEAKHFAALAFLEKFSNYKKNKQSKRTQTNPTPAVDPVTICSKEFEMLEAICLKKKLGSPKVKDVCIGGLYSTKIFTAKCKVLDLSIASKGNSQSEARLQAIMKMIQLITGIPSIRGILRSKLAESEMQLLALTLYNNEMISPHNSKKKSQLLLQDDMNGRQKVEQATSPDNPTAKPTVPTNSDIAKTSFESMNACKTAGKVEYNNNNSVSNVNRRHLADDSQQKTTVTKLHSSRSLNNNVSNCVNNGCESTSPDKFRENLTPLRVVSQINRTVGNLEKQLNDEMLNTLAYCDLPHRQTVAIHSHVYEVFIHESSPSYIYEGNIDCTDPSIRVACLTKILIRMKKYIEVN